MLYHVASDTVQRMVAWNGGGMNESTGIFRVVGRLRWTISSRQLKY